MAPNEDPFMRICYTNDGSAIVETEGEVSIIPAPSICTDPLHCEDCPTCGGEDE